MKLFLKNLNHLFQFKTLVFIFIIITFFRAHYITTNKIYYSKYNGTENQIQGYILNYQINGNHLQLLIKGQEKIIVNYFFKIEDELIDFKTKYKIGDYIISYGEFIKPSPNRTFNLFNYQNYLLSKKIYWLYNAETIEIINKNNKLLYLFKQKIINQIEKSELSQGYIKAFILADKNYLNEEIINTYQNNGTSHLLAVSGSHVSFLILIIRMFLKKINFNNKINEYIIIIILLFYLFITMAPASLLRAVMFYIIIFISKNYKLKIKTNYLLLLLCLFILCYNPYYIYDVGFVFSFLISFYLITYSDFFSNDKNYLLKLVKISFISFLVSIPILINNFFQINFISPLINLIYVPLFVFIIFPLSIVTFLFPILDKLLFTIILISENISLFFSKLNYFIFYFSKINIIIIIIYYIIITIVLNNLKIGNFSKIKYLFLLLIIHYNINYFNTKPFITIIDVGQGDSILIQLPYNQGNLLIDTGGIVQHQKEDWKAGNKIYSIGINTIIPYMKSVGIKKLNYLILTHGDFDHIGEGENIINNFPIYNIILNSGHINKMEESVINLANIKKINYYLYNRGELILGNNKFYFLNKKNTKNENEDSLIIYAKLNNKHILLLGDAGNDTEKYLLTEYNLPQMDILKIGHHGSKYSSSEEFLKTINPQYSFISVGFNNRFNHPHQEVLDRLDKYNLKYEMTSHSGSIKIILDNNIIIKKSLVSR